MSVQFPGIIFVFIFLLYVDTLWVEAQNIKKRPFGPNMCSDLCHHTVGCSTCRFSVSTFTCSIGNSTLTDNPSNVISFDIKEDKFKGISANFESRYSIHSRFLHSKTRGIILVPGLRTKTSLIMQMDAFLGTNEFYRRKKILGFPDTYRISTRNLLQKVMGHKKPAKYPWETHPSIPRCLEELDPCQSQFKSGSRVKAFRTKCYDFVTHVKMQWDAAEKSCRKQGGNLAVISDNDTQEFILHNLKAIAHKGKGLWIGLTDIAKEGHWKWVTGAAVTYHQWTPSHNGLLGYAEDCTKLRSKDGKWIGHPCSSPMFQFGYICQYDLLATKLGPPSGFMCWKKQ